MNNTFFALQNAAAFAQNHVCLDMVYQQTKAVEKIHGTTPPVNGVIVQQNIHNFFIQQAKG